MLKEKAKAKKMNLNDLTCFVALSTMDFGRSVEKSIENAMYWSKNGKEAILDTFFTKDPEAL
jgi:hypothetical protein